MENLYVCHKHFFYNHKSTGMKKPLAPIIVIIIGLLILVYGQGRNNSSEANIVNAGLVVMGIGVIYFVINLMMSAKRNKVNP